jgi:septal ring factor EnvC (AmiA/AmiB activator)
MTDDIFRRLRAQTLVLSSLRAEARLTAHDDLLADAERMHLRGFAEDAKELLHRLEDQSDALAAALKHAANVRRDYADVVHGEASVGAELEHIVSATDACHDHISMATHRDEASKDQEREVMRLLQLATLQGFG